MRIERALAVRDSLVTRVRDCYSIARIATMPSAECDAALRDVFTKVPPRTPAWVIQYARGYARALQNDLYENHLVHGGIVDGVFYSTHSSRPDYYGKHGIEPRDYADDGKVTMRGHYWASNTSRPYFRSCVDAKGV